MAIDFTKSAPVPDSSSGQPAPKVILTKGSPRVSLDKETASAGVTRINLRWTARPVGFLEGLFRRRSEGNEAIDLDLGCLYHFTDGSIGVVQSLGRTFTSMPVYGPSPVIRLDGDDRSGNNSDGENLFIDLSQMQRIRRILVFASIYSGASNWASAAGVVTLSPYNAPPVEIHLDEPDPKARHCAVAMLENRDGLLNISREMRYITGTQRHLDQAYNWGLRWTTGYK